MKIRFSGFGGQGIVMAGLITGGAAVIEGRNAVQTQSYGSASRGGSCKSDVYVSKSDIHELEFHEPDILVTFSQEAYSKYAGDLPKGGRLFLDSDMVTPDREFDRLYAIQATEIAYKQFERKIIANLVMLGFVTGVAEPVSKEAMMESIRRRVPKGTEEMNLEAFEAGYTRGAEAGKGEGGP
jgi:2-oxoglutarate ferredoxin oxidoreductase subunit gamma